MNRSCIPGKQASKHPDVEMEMIDEAQTYEFLKELQGKTIPPPRLVHFGYVSDGPLALVTDFAGSTLGLGDVTGES